jgi:hypothetical protein
MSVTTRSLWPTDLHTDDVRTPTEILVEQAQLLEKETKGVLQGRVTEPEVEGRKILAFEVVAPRIPVTTRLFEVQQSPQLEYPVAIIPPNVAIPDYLKREVYRPSGMEAVLAGPVVAGRMETNEWVADTPLEFRKKLEKLLSSSGVKAILYSLLARSKRTNPASE